MFLQSIKYSTKDEDQESLFIPFRISMNSLRERRE